MSDFYFRTEGLTVGYDGKPLIRDIEIHLNRGEILTLIGPNGSGKSTILKSITRALRPIGGVVYLGGSPVEGMSGRDLSRQVAVVLTGKPKTELMTCYDVVATGRYPYTGSLGILSREDHVQVQEAMELVNAWDLREQDFTRISDGQRQRILLARAICHQPQIIVLDEPTSFLDIRYQLDLLGILRGMTETRGMAVILSLHELDMAQKLSDAVMCVKGEYITHYGPPQEIFQRSLIRELYSLEKGSYNPLFGSLELARPEGTPQLFVIAGGGTGVAEYRKLQKKGLPFLTGVLHENDIDYQLASDLAAEVVSTPPFEPISDAALARALALLKTCQTLIHCPLGYGTMNAANRQLLEAAQSQGLRCLTTADEL